MESRIVYVLLAVILCTTGTCNCAELYNFTTGSEDNFTTGSEDLVESSARINLTLPFFLDGKAYTSLYVSLDVVNICCYWF